MRRWIHPLRLIWIALLLLVVGIVTAQDDLRWLLNLLPTAQDVNVNKLLSQTTEGEILASDNPALEQHFDAVNSWSSDATAGWNFAPKDKLFSMFSRDSEFSLIALDREGQQYADVVVSVDMMPQNTDIPQSYGLVCRAQDGNTGYHFLITTDGQYTIQLRQNETVLPLIDWTPNEVIKSNAADINRMTAVCVKDYFALYLNGVLLSEVRDTTYEAGQIGMALTLLDGSAVTVNFDNLWVWEANAEGLPVTCPTQHEIEFTETMAIDELEKILGDCLGKGNQQIVLENLALVDDFSSSDNWQVVDNTDGFLGVQNDLLIAAARETITFPISLTTSQEYNNVAVQVDVRFVDGSDNNAYGLVCRGNDDALSRGYYFIISADGQFTVQVSDGIGFRVMNDWVRSDRINQQGQNRLTAVCTDSYLAFYINNELVIELFDTIYTGGQVGVTMFSYEGMSEVEFDNMLVWETSSDDLSQ